MLQQPIENEYQVNQPFYMEPVFDKSQLLQFGMQLQSSLELPNILSHFFTTLENLGLCTGLEYDDIHYPENISLGCDADHHCRYHLIADTEDLGSLLLSNHTTYSEKDLSTIEDYLAFLVYPLRNAQHYHTALQSALIDSLTGIHNRMAFEKNLSQELLLTKRHNLDLSLLFIDIDNFKNINDEFGHSMGDKIIKAVAEELKINARDSDMVYRLGGEEFILILRNTHIEGAIKLADRMRSEVANLSSREDLKNINTTVSIGLSAYISNDSPESLLERADAALYRAKQQGKNRVCL